MVIAYYTLNITNEAKDTEMKKPCHKAITVHTHRAISGLMIVAAAAVWLYVPDQEEIIIGLIAAERLVMVQFRGFICNTFESLLGWTKDFRSDL